MVLWSLWSLWALSACTSSTPMQTFEHPGFSISLPEGELATEDGVVVVRRPGTLSEFSYTPVGDALPTAQKAQMLRDAFSGQSRALTPVTAGRVAGEVAHGFGLADGHELQVTVWTCSQSAFQLALVTAGTEAQAHHQRALASVRCGTEAAAAAPRAAVEPPSWTGPDGWRPGPTDVSSWAWSHPTGARLWVSGGVGQGPDASTQAACERFIGLLRDNSVVHQAEAEPRILVGDGRCVGDLVGTDAMTKDRARRRLVRFRCADSHYTSDCIVPLTADPSVCHGLVSCPADDR